MQRPRRSCCRGPSSDKKPDRKNRPQVLPLSGSDRDYDSRQCQPRIDAAIRSDPVIIPRQRTSKNSYTRNEYNKNLQGAAIRFNRTPPTPYTQFPFAPDQQEKPTDNNDRAANRKGEPNYVHSPISSINPIEYRIHILPPTESMRCNRPTDELTPACSCPSASRCG